MPRATSYRHRRRMVQMNRLFSFLGWTWLGLALDVLENKRLRLGPSSSSPAGSAQPNGRKQIPKGRPIRRRVLQPFLVPASSPKQQPAAPGVEVNDEGSGFHYCSWFEAFVMDLVPAQHTLQSLLQTTSVCNYASK